jgi:hypothetical protein
VKRERLALLADNPLYTQRFAYYVGRRCRSATIKDIAEELRLDWNAPRGRPFCSTSSTSFVTSAKRSTPCAIASTAGSRASRAPSSRDRNIPAHPQNLTGSARKNLKLLLAANRRLNTAYLLKESFGQMWDYNREGWARNFFENWRAQPKWRRLKRYEDFADMIERHWDGIAAYCKPENKVSAAPTDCATKNTFDPHRIRMTLIRYLR